MVHIKGIGKHNDHQRYNESAPYNQNNINQSTENSPREEIPIADCCHGDYSEPHCILKFLQVGRVLLSKHFGILYDQVSLSNSETEGKNNNTNGKDNSNKAEWWVLEEALNSVQVIGLAPVHSAQSAG